MQVVNLKPLYYVPLHKIGEPGAKLTIALDGQADDQIKKAGKYPLTISVARRFVADLLFGLDHDVPEVFATAACNRFHWVYLAYRVIVALYFIAIAIYSGITEFNGSGKWFIYFTNWTYICLTFSAIFQALCVIYHRVIIDYYQKTFGDESGYKKMPILYEINWLLNNIVVVSAMLVTVSYWGYVYTHGGLPEGHPLGLGSITKHAINALHVIINLFISKIPMKGSHVFQPLIFHLMYFIFTVLFWACGGTDYFGNPYIYQQISFQHAPWWSLFLMLAFVLTTVPMFYVMYALVMIRDYVITHYGCGKEPRKVLKQKRNHIHTYVNGKLAQKMNINAPDGWALPSQGFDTVSAGIAQRHLRLNEERHLRELAPAVSRHVAADPSAGGGLYPTLPEAVLKSPPLDDARNCHNDAICPGEEWIQINGVSVESICV